MEKICVVGLGYIGLPTSVVLASAGKSVVGFDVNPATVAKIADGKSHILEPGLDELLWQTVTSGKFRATTKIEQADAYIIAVPTPIDDVSKVSNLSFVKAAAKSISTVLQAGNLIILESTSPVGTTETLLNLFLEYRPDLFSDDEGVKQPDFYLAYCPERVIPGSTLRELIQNDRIIGGINNESSKQAVDLYKNFVEGNCIIASSSRVAEMSKLVENSYRDVNIAFANELSIMSSELDIDVTELIGLANMHPRVNILKPGAGVGGHCIAVDPWFLVEASPANSKLIRTAREVNDYKTTWVIHQIHAKIQSYFQKNERFPNVGFYGITFKPDIDDLRESPALKIVKNLCEKFQDNIFVIEPNIEDLPIDLKCTKISLGSPSIQDLDLHIFLVAHSEFRSIDKETINYSDYVDILE